MVPQPSAWGLLPGGAVWRLRKWLGKRAAFAMGKKGIEFIELLPGFEGYMIDRDRMATVTNGFAHYVYAGN